MTTDSFLKFFGISLHHFMKSNFPSRPSKSKLAMIKEVEPIVYRIGSGSLDILDFNIRRLKLSCCMQTCLTPNKTF
ncbi:hypothetical protein T01_4808 [Trichinella spiralis]|uniref:Uncharacterized protein n=1 Tax=Trichinella spiralis TaxID=6334 RepID=A0A0V1BYR2_TRISP|nr:hypothetical protein T01_4808 [Trichinella spiralis]